MVWREVKRTGVSMSPPTLGCTTKAQKARHVASKAREGQWEQIEGVYIRPSIQGKTPGVDSCPQCLVEPRCLINTRRDVQATTTVAKG